MNPASLMSRPRRGLTLRARLTCTTVVTFAFLGGGLLLLNWLSVRQLIAIHRDLLTPDSVPSSAPRPTSAPVIPSAPTGPAHPPPGSVRSEATSAHSFEDFKRSVLTGLFTHSLILLAAFTALAALLAWWFSRRSLRRLGHVAEAAARINNGNHLGERLALTGPHDEVGRLGDTIDAMLERLEQSFTAQRRFTAQASHELRTPLTIQRTALEIPLSQGRVPAALEPALRAALNATTRSENLLASLLALARGESGLTTARPTDLADTVRTALADLRTEITERDIHIRTRLNPAPVTGDPALLAQLTLNLLANAVRHNHPGGHVHLTTGETQSGAWIEVTNTGTLIDPTQIPALFEPFHRATAPSIKGAGLGLAVVRAITGAHHGDVHAHPNPEGGLIVRAELGSGGGFRGCDGA
ncbi:sensor histidine kinase [Streptomyces sp. WZ-12]|uniref:sensor histidine kinase n=1 Tax=Streptomyces sp. WZ-12 TaxID=3030210 RepID=UPI002380C7B6|nr:HAMP domain-containing sensor histidine kinase [Streptomyces sp. WZ-12]